MVKKKLPYGQKGVKVMEWLNKEPQRTDAHIASYVGCHPTYVTSLRKKMVHAQPELELAEEQIVDPKPGEFIEVEGELTPNEIDAVLDERGKRYGNFLDHARISQRLKNVAHQFASENGKRFDVDQAEALDMIFHKIGRILNGDPNYADSWIDIAGYAKLVADRLEGKVR